MISGVKMWRYDFSKITWYVIYAILGRVILRNIVKQYIKMGYLRKLDVFLKSYLTWWDEELPTIDEGTVGEKLGKLLNFAFSR